MFKEIKLQDIERDGFLHSILQEFQYDNDKKLVIIKLSGADLTIGGIFYNCVFSITDWWDFEVLQCRGDHVINTFSGNNIPELESIIEYSYDGETLILGDLCGFDELYQFRFTRPKIKITGVYKPD